MRIQEHANKLETNVEAETQDFGIGDPSVIIDILRNRLYEHKIRTTCQEYICNARDAMREVGKSNSFEITVPTRLNPVFKVRDFGLGITPERMANVFVKYGASTKRGTNNQTGGFGIGAKSAWSYTDSFTVVTFVDGVKRSYVAHIGVNNQGRLDLVSTDQTDEENGTEIQVAVKPYDIEEFRTSIFRAIYFWSDKPTLKGELNPPTLVRGEVVSDLLEVVDRELLPEYVRTWNSEDILAVIDGIPYVIGEKLSNKVKPLESLNLLCRKMAVLHFGNGVVEVAASRESIADSKHTLAALEKLGHKAVMEAQTHISDAFGKVKDTPDYLRTYVTMSKVFDVDNFAKYGDYSINSSRILNPNFKKIKMTIAHCMGKYGRGRVDKITKDELSEGRKEIEIDRLQDMFFVTTQENKLVRNKRLREYFKTRTHVVILEVLHTNIPKLDAKGQTVLDKDNKQVYEPVSYPKEFKKVVAELGAKDFTTITYVDPPKEARVKVQREDAAICLHGTRYGTRHVYTTLAKNTQKWIYVRLSEGQWPSKCDRETATELDEYTSKAEDMKVCGVAEKAAKTIEGDPNFISLEDWLKDFKPNKDTILAAKMTLAKNHDSVNTICGLVKDADDPALDEMVKEYTAFTKAKIRSIPSILANKIAELKEVREFKEADAAFGKLMKEEYPLAVELGNYSRNKKELVIAESDERFEEILNAIREANGDEARLAASIPAIVEIERRYSGEGIELRDGLLVANNEPLPVELEDRIIKFKAAKLPYDPLIKFWENLKKNPSFNSRKMLFKFLEHNGHPLTTDGCFIAYRGVTEDFKDVHTKTFDNKVGNVCEMPRSQVDENPNNTCSSGLHVACFDYAKGFGAKLIEVKVNPADVVAVPTDYNGTKMRVCRFEVVAEGTVIKETLLEDFGSDEEDTYCDECGTDRDYYGCACDEEAQEELEESLKAKVEVNGKGKAKQRRYATRGPRGQFVKANG
ncbi:unnamed protein product [Sphagnum jensenii]|uniref:Uncharacterized protein n=1 Tax=Sphagnum jensenii TaxID=128206 RepID=A0ABP0V819_9BRYO